MPRFLVERYLPDGDAGAVDDLLRRVAAASDSFRTNGVTYRRTIYLPDDELCLCEFDGTDADAVLRANLARGLPVDRIVVAVEHSAT